MFFRIPFTNVIFFCSIKKDGNRHPLPQKMFQNPFKVYRLPNRFQFHRVPVRVRLFYAVLRC